ncbi:hypothetical protein pdam_00015358, partial [Pocillopora damicornis]
VILKDMNMKYEMKGSVHGHDFKIGNWFKHTSMFHGVNFPANGPIMQKRTIGWDPSFEKMTVSNNILRGDVTMFLQLKGGGYHSCQFHTSYKTKEPVTLPQNHVVEHRITRTDIEDKKVLLEETAVAHLQRVNMSHSSFFQQDLFIFNVGPRNAMFYDVVLRQRDRLEHSYITSQYVVGDGHFLKGRVPANCPLLHYGSVSGKVNAMKHGCVLKPISLKTVILKDMNMKGSVNRNYFEIEGEGKGKPKEGIRKSTYWVTKGGPLSFSFDVLSSAFKYRNRCFTEYPADMPDFFEQAFPPGMSFERTFKI